LPPIYLHRQVKLPLPRIRISDILKVMERKLGKHAGILAVLTALPILYFAQAGAMRYFAPTVTLLFAQEKTSIIPVVPAANWRLVDSQPLPVSAVKGYGGDPSVEVEYGVRALELRTYEMGKTQMQVVVEETPDATSAYGLLTFYQTPAMTPEKDIQLAVGDANTTLMAHGRNFIRFLRGKDSSLSESDYHALLDFVGGSRPSPTALRNLPSAMPPHDLIPGSEKYLLGLEAAKRVLPSFRTDLIGFEQGAEVQLGQYRTTKGPSTLLLISYPNPQIARLRFGALRSLLGLNQDRGENSVYGRREGSYVFLVLNAENPGGASALMDQFQVTRGVSWDERYPQSKRAFTLQLIYMLLSIFLLCAFLIGICVAGGILFFVSRRLAAKFFPEWQWGRTDEDQLIRLNLKSY
jgi:hypothetical protein